MRIRIQTDDGDELDSMQIEPVELYALCRDLSEMVDMHPDYPDAFSESNLENVDGLLQLIDRKEAEEAWMEKII